jgi:hypothetical protein
MPAVTTSVLLPHRRGQLPGVRVVVDALVAHYQLSATPRQHLPDPRVLALRDVEAQIVGRALRLERVARRQHDALAQALPRQCGGVAAIGQLAPQEQAGFRLQPRRDAQRLQFPQCVPACIGQARTYRLHVAAVTAVGQRDVHQLRGQMATAKLVASFRSVNASIQSWRAAM